MKKWILLIITVLIFTISGCGPQEQMAWKHNIYDAPAIVDAYSQRRQDLFASFKEAYPDNWEEKLLEYELRQEGIRKQQQALYRQRELMRQYQKRQAWQKFWQDFSNVQQRELDRQAYGRQPIIITHPRNPNYYQEQLAQQQLSDSYRKKYNIK